MSFSLRILNENQIDPTLDRAIRAVLCVCFPADAAHFAHTRAWHGSLASFTVLAEEPGRIIGHVGVIDRVIRAGNHPIRIAGVQNVCVIPGFRGLGISDALMNAAMRESRRRGMDLGLLFCLPALEKVYQRCGWKKVLVPEIWATTESGQHCRLGEKNSTMLHPLTRADVPPGSIDLKGDDW